MKKTFLFVSGFIFFISLSVAFTTSDPPRYKNLQILPKDISKQAMDSTMHFFSFALGQKCGFCHVRNEESKSWDMASDVKPEKLIARKMLTMCQGINKTYFSEEGGNEQQAIQAVTCYTCHKGEPMPLAFPEKKDSTMKR